MKKILYVDDSEDMLEIVNLVLTKLGYQVITVTSGAAALEVCSEENPDLVLMDLNMPNRDGFTTTQQLKDNGYKNPIVVLTGSENEEDRAKAQAIGCADYILKTVDMHDIENVISRYL